MEEKQKIRVEGEEMKKKWREEIKENKNQVEKKMRQCLGMIDEESKKYQKEIQGLKLKN